MAKFRDPALVLQPAKAEDAPEDRSAFNDLTGALVNFGTSFGTAAAASWLGQQRQTNDRQPAPTPRPSAMDWIRENALLAGGIAVALVAVLFVALRRR